MLSWKNERMISRRTEKVMIGAMCEVKLIEKKEKPRTYEFAGFGRRLRD